MEDPIGLDGTVLGFHCKVDWSDPSNMQYLANTSANTYYTKGGEWQWQCGDGSGAAHNFTLAEMQANGWELGSSVSDIAVLDAHSIIAMAREALEMGRVD